MGRIGRSWEMVKASWGVLRADKELLLYPLMGGILRKMGVGSTVDLVREALEIERLMIGLNGHNGARAASDRHASQRASEPEAPMRQLATA